MSFFDDKFSDINYRMKVLKLFPDEFAQGYVLYKQGKLGPETLDDTFLDDDLRKKRYGWYLLDPDNTVKFNLHGTDIPILVNALPAILDLDAAQELDRKK
jgi:hypothetical protein